MGFYRHASGFLQAYSGLYRAIAASTYHAGSGLGSVGLACHVHSHFPTTVTTVLGRSGTQSRENPTSLGKASAEIIGRPLFFAACLI